MAFIARRGVWVPVSAAVIVAAAVAVDAYSGSPSEEDRAADPADPVVAPRDRARFAPPSASLPRRDSEPIGVPEAGRLKGGVKLPVEGPHHFAWDPVKRQVPNRGWRRWGAYGVVRLTLRVVGEFRRANPGAPRVGIGDLSRPRGGDFGPRFGLPGHATHQNGLDVDLYYPRRDGSETAPDEASEIDRELSQDLVDRFVEAGAEWVLVGPNTGLDGPPSVVQAIPNHDNHVHVRFPRSLA